MRSSYIGVLFLTLLSVTTVGQSLFEPNYALKKPHTLEILNIELKESETIINISIENLIEGGYFCIDPETYIITDKGDRLKITRLSGLPFCPDQYRFKRVEEVKYVTMRFPPIDKDTKWADLIEECGDNCLSVYGISLEPSLNVEINLCFNDIEYGREGDAIDRFEILRNKLADSGNPMLGSIYLNLISLYKNEGSDNKAELLKKELINAIIPHKSLFLETLK